jgi:hypothetical protein
VSTSGREQPQAAAVLAALEQASQQAFAQALLDPALPPPGELVAWNASDPRLRFAVYRNNVSVSLVAALADTFPVLRALVGDEFFDAMARLYVADEPPRSPVLAHYGEGMADWLAHFAPAASLPYLPDLARLERARVRAYHAADAPSLGTDAVAARLAEPAQLAQARLRLHPSLSVLDSRYAIVSLWAAHQGHAPLEAVVPDRPECALVLRADDDAAVLDIPPGAATFYRRLLQGQPLARAASRIEEPFNLGESLAILIRHGAISAWQLDGKHR